MRNILIALIVTVAAALLSLPSREDSVAMPVAQHAVASNVEAMQLIRCQPGFFVPNLGQWNNAARFVHRSGPMTLFLENRGWTVDLAERPASVETAPHSAHQPSDRDVELKFRGVALRMTFEGDAHIPEIVGEKMLEGHHNYFLGSDKSRWRTGVPLYSSVRYKGLYPGIDLRLREMNGVPEYDLLLQPGADLSRVKVHVEGGQGLSIARDGSLVIETALGPVTQSMPKTWQVGGDGGKCEVVCNFTLLGADRFGFEAPGWDGDTSLTIDPGLIWSTFLGGSGVDDATALAVDASGVVTVAGYTASTNFPTTSGAYDTTFNGGIANTPGDVFVSRLDPRKTGAAQLVYSTFLGGTGDDSAWALSVDASGVVTVAGETLSTNFPTTSGAYDTTHNGIWEAFISRLDPQKTGTAQLVYSTFLGGRSGDFATALSVDASGVVTVAGYTASTNFPTTSGAFDTTWSGSTDAFVSRLDTSKTGTAQLVYSTFLGGGGGDSAWALSVDASGVVTVAGYTYSTNFPTTSGAYDTTHNGSLYWNGHRWVRPTDVFVSRLDPRKTGAAQLVYSTFLGGHYYDYARALSVDASGVVTVAGYSWSANFPTTSGAYNTTFNGCDVFVSRLDPTRAGSAQLVYSTFLGGGGSNAFLALSVDASGVVTVAGHTYSTNFPTTSGAYDRTYNGPRYGYDAFVSRLDMGVALYGDVHVFPITTGGTQKLTVHAGRAHANRLYWIFGSVSGTTPGVSLLGVHIPLNPDLYTDVAMAHVNTTAFTKFRGTLDANGLATASFNVPANLPVASGFTFHHAYVVYDASGIFMASNAVPLRLK